MRFMSTSKRRALKFARPGALRAKRKDTLRRPVGIPAIRVCLPENSRAATIPSVRKCRRQLKIIPAPACRNAKVSRKASRDTGARMSARSVRLAMRADNKNVTGGAMSRTNGLIFVTKERGCQRAKTLHA
jgi:hypothetical protein